jgi:hypothetical protein
MAIVKRIVCLANSRKHSGLTDGRCIAGKELVGDQGMGWIRPVSAREHEEVSISDRRCEDGSEPHVLDIIDVPFLRAQPKGYQQENWLLDPSRRWIKINRAKSSDLDRFVDPMASLWTNGYSSYNGLNDRVPLALTAELKNSLCLIMVDDLKLSVLIQDVRKRVIGRFHHGGAQYWLWVTDPISEMQYRTKPEGDYEIGKSFLTISLGEPFKEFCYKLIAAIISHDGGHKS